MQPVGGFMSPEGKLQIHVGLPPPLTAVGSVRKSPREKKPRPATSSSLKLTPTVLNSKPFDLPTRTSDSYIKRLNIGLNFTRDVVSESAPSALRFQDIRARDIYKSPSSIQRKRHPESKRGPMGRHNAIGDPMSHIPCTLPVPLDQAEIRETKAYPSKPFLKNVAQEVESVAAQTSVAVSTTQWDEYVLNKLSLDTADLIVNKHSHGLQRERLQQKVLSENREEIESCTFREGLHMDVEPIIMERKHGIEQATSKDSIISFVMTDQSDKDTTTSGKVGNKDDKSQVEEEEHFPAYLGKPLQRNYMEKFMTKAQRKREVGLDPEQEKYVSSNYNRHKLLNDIQPFTEDILQGKQPIHYPGNMKRIIFDQQTQYMRDLIPSYPQQPGTWGPKIPTKRNIPLKGYRPWKYYPKLIITTYQRQVLSDMSEGGEGSSTTPVSGYMEGLLENDELTHQLLLNALSHWRTTWYLDNKWRDSTLESVVADMKDISEHVRITAAIACGAALGYREDWDLEESPDTIDTLDDEEDAPISGYRTYTYSPSLPSASSKRSAGHGVVDNLVKLLHDKSSRVQVAASVTLLAIGASQERAKHVLLRALAQPNTMVADTWAAVQCLAMENITERIVVDKLIIMTQSLDQLIRLTATKLLVRLSTHSDVILFMVADELNNKLWINRYMACKVIQKIQTPLNKDILHKLLTLMWSDYTDHIRSAAAETIGVKGHGQFLHEELVCRLRKGNESQRVDALNRVIELQMMTGRMKSVFLRCFTDDHVSVRHTAARGAGILKFADTDIIAGLISRIRDDHSHKVKAAAIEALAEIGVVNEQIIEQLVWSAQYQQDAQVRSAACLVLAMLRVDREDVVNTLRDRLTADADNSVKKASMQALQMLGLKPEKDASLIIAIKEAVKKLGSKDSILASIINAESTEHRTAQEMDRESKSREQLQASSSRQLSRDNKSRPISRERTQWPEPKEVISREKESRSKKEKIQQLLSSHENKTPATKFLWRQSTPASVS